MAELKDDMDYVDDFDADALAGEAQNMQQADDKNPLLKAMQLIGVHMKNQGEQRERQLEELAKLEAEAKAPLLPDGIGMSLDDIRLMLAHVHEMKPPEKDDPLLMVVSILNAHLAELEKLHQRQCKALNKLMADQTQNYVQGVQETAEKLAQSLQSASLEGLQNLLQRVDHLKTALWLAGAVVSLSALLNVAVFVLRGLK